MFQWLCVLGDCILDILFAEYLLEYQSFSKFDGFDEIFNANTKMAFANLACDLNLHNIILHKFDYDNWILIKNGTFSKDYLYRSKYAEKTAVIVEAVAGAVLVDCDFDLKCVHDILYEKIKISFHAIMDDFIDAEENDDKKKEEEEDDDYDYEKMNSEFENQK